MATLAITNSFVAGVSEITAAAFNANFTDIKNFINNALIDTGNISATAGITSGQIESLATTKLTGMILNAQIDSMATIKLTGTITNAQLAGSIATSKLVVAAIGRGVVKTGNDAVVIDLNGKTVATVWTQVDLTASTSANARIALIQFTITLHTVPTTSERTLQVWAKSNDDNAIADANIKRSVVYSMYSKDAGAGSPTHIETRTVPVALDAGQIFQYQVTLTAPGTGWNYDLQAYVVGYIEDFT